MRRIIFLLITLLLVNLPFYTFAMEKKFYFCFPLTKDPVLDGKLNDESWKNMPVATDFIMLGSNVLSTKQTSFKMGYTREALYIGIECEEPEAKKIKAELKDMEALWKEDSIEIFIFPKEADNYFQFVVNTIGSRWNGIGLGERIPLGNWQAKTYRGKDHYSIEIKIAFEIFHAIPKKGEAWTGNICRNIFTSGGRFTCWAYLKSSFHEPYNFGRIIFVEEGAKKDEIIINLLKNEILANLKLISALEKDFSEAQKRHFSLQKELVSFWKNYEEIRERISHLNSEKEAILLLEKSEKLLKESDELKIDILSEDLFDE